MVGNEPLWWNASSVPRFVYMCTMKRPDTAVYPPGAHLRERVIDDHELVWLLHGQATLVCESPLVLSPGQLLLIPPGWTHAIDWAPRRTARHGYVHFEQSDVTSPLPAQVLVVPMSGADPLASLCAYLVRLGSTGPTARATLDFLVRLMLSAPEPDPVPVPVADHLKRAWARLPMTRAGTPGRPRSSTTRGWAGCTGWCTNAAG